MTKQECEKIIAMKLNEIAGALDDYDPEINPADVTMYITRDNVAAYIYRANEEYPLDAWEKRKPAKALKYTPEVEAFINSVVAESKLNNDENEMCWATDQGIDLLAHNLKFRLRKMDFDAKEA